MYSYPRENDYDPHIIPVNDNSDIVLDGVMVYISIYFDDIVRKTNDYTEVYTELLEFDLSKHMTENERKNAIYI